MRLPPAFLKGHDFTDEDARVAWDYCGGKPVCLVELINRENREETAKEMFTFRIGELETRLKLVKELGAEMMIVANVVMYIMRNWYLH